MAGINAAFILYLRLWPIPLLLQKMKQLLLVLILLLASTGLVAAQQSAVADTLPRPLQKDTNTIVLGDLNNDRVIDTAFVTGPKWLDDTEGWGDCRDGNCEVSISFSCGFPVIERGNAVTAGVENIGDIDGDGFSEIVVIPGWFIGCWGMQHVYTYKKGNWLYCGAIHSYNCGDESFVSRMKRVSKHKIRVMEDVWDDDEGGRIAKPVVIRIK